MIGVDTSAQDSGGRPIYLEPTPGTVTVFLLITYGGSKRQKGLFDLKNV
jgi:hypothetical protein